MAGTGASRVTHGNAPRGAFDAAKGSLEIGLGVHRAQSVMPGGMKIDPLLQGRAEEAPGQLAIVQRSLAIRGRLALEPEQQTESRAHRLHPDWQTGGAEGVAQAGVEDALQVLEVRPERRVGDFVEERVGGGSRARV